MKTVLERWYQLHQKYLYCDRKPFDFRTSSLADYLGVNRRTIQRWVRGKGEPDENQAAQIQEYLHEQAGERS